MSTRNSPTGVSARSPSPVPTRSFRSDTAFGVENTFPASRNPTPPKMLHNGNRISWLSTTDALPPAGSPEKKSTGPSPSCT